MVARLSRQTLYGILRQMDAALDGQPEAPRQTLCVFGASAVLMYGYDERQTQDIDIWRSASIINDRAIEEMVRHTNIDINPTELQSEKIYLQIISDGVVRLPPFSKSAAAWPSGQPSEVLWEGKKLTDCRSSARNRRCGENGAS